MLIEGSLDYIRESLELADDSGIVEMICAVTGIDPDEVSLELSNDNMLPSKPSGVKKNDPLSEHANCQRETACWKDGRYLDSTWSVLIIFTSWGFSDSRATFTSGYGLDSAYDILFASTAATIWSLL